MNAARPVLLVLSLAATPALAQGPPVDPADWEHLAEPRIVERPDETMLVVEATGDPNVIGAQAFGTLFQLYFSSGLATGPTPPIPRARWPEDLLTPQDEWLGQYALPVSGEVPGVETATLPPGITASVTTWAYGEVAEILHVGPYDREQATMERLRAYVRAQGYETFGGHEEEYILGPSMAGPGDPGAYLTILRYRVRPRP